MDNSKHHYEVNGVKNIIELIIFSKENLEIIKENLNEFIYKSLTESEIKLESINLTIKISDIIGEELNLKLDDDILNVISEILGNDEYGYDSDFKGYYIWIK